MKVRLLGGRYDGVEVELSSTPRRIRVGEVEYVRIDDPDTGEFLGGYYVGI